MSKSGISNNFSPWKEKTDHSNGKQHRIIFTQLLARHWFEDF